MKTQLLLQAAFLAFQVSIFLAAIRTHRCLAFSQAFRRTAKINRANPEILVTQEILPHPVALPLRMLRQM